MQNTIEDIKHNESVTPAESNSRNAVALGVEARGNGQNNATISRPPVVTAGAMIAANSRNSAVFRAYVNTDTPRLDFNILSNLISWCSCRLVLYDFDTRIFRIYKFLEQ